MKYLTILSLGLSLLMLPVVASAMPKQSSAIVLSINGSACIQKISQCIPIQVGQNLYPFDRIKIVNGEVSIYSLHARKRESLVSAEYTVPNLTSAVTDSKEYAFRRLEVLSKIKNRSTASTIFRSGQNQLCLESRESQESCLQKMRQELQVLRSGDVDPNEKNIASHLIFLEYGDFEGALKVLKKVLE